MLVISQQGGSRGHEMTMDWMPILNTVGAAVALVGVGYSAIAFHRGDRGIVLWLAWLFSVAGALLDIEPVVYLL